MRIIDMSASKSTAIGYPTLVSANKQYITMYVWFEVDEDLEVDLIVESHWPRYRDKKSLQAHTWLEYELESEGLSMFLPQIDVNWMLSEGVAPGQLLLVEFYGYYFKTWTDYGDEYDAEHDVDVLWREPMSPSAIIEAYSPIIERYAQTNDRS